MRRMPVLLLQAIPLAVFVAAWELSVRHDKKLVFFFGTPSKVFDYIATKTMDGSLIIDFGTTLLEALLGFLIGNVVGTLLGLAFWFSRTAVTIVRPYIVALSAAPIFALAPLFIIWFGTGLLSKVMMATFSTVFLALFQAYTGATQVREEYVQLMHSFGATRNQIFRKVIAPSAVVWVISAFKMNIGMALLGAFIGEFISSERGLGHLILVASGLFDISLVLAGVVCLMLIAVFFNIVLARLEIPIKHLVARCL
ncbi:MAG TPA: ABC transporter permease [Candidatus Obscuribacterales bacterium]